MIAMSLFAYSHRCHYWLTLMHGEAGHEFVTNHLDYGHQLFQAVHLHPKPPKFGFSQGRSRGKRRISKPFNLGKRPALTRIQLFLPLLQNHITSQWLHSSPNVAIWLLGYNTLKPINRNWLFFIHHRILYLTETNVGIPEGEIQRRRAAKRAIPWRVDLSGSEAPRFLCQIYEMRGQHWYIPCHITRSMAQFTSCLHVSCRHW